MSRDLPRQLLFVTTGLGSGGAENMLAQIVLGLHSETIQCSVASLASGGKYVDQLRDSGITVHDLGMRPGRPSLSALWRLREIALAAKPDALIGWMYHGCLAATLIRRGPLRDTPLTWNIRQTLYSLEKEKRGSAMVIRFLAKLSRKHPHTILYNSRLSAQQHEQIGYDASKTQLVPNGFDTSRFHPQPEAHAQIRKELFLPGDAYLVGRIGRNAAMKDHATALGAAATICRNHPNVHFLFAGTGMTRDEPEFQDFLKKQPGVTTQVHFLGERHDLPRLTAALDLALSTSSFGEGFPNVVGEAMACGVPVIATDIGDTKHVLGPHNESIPPKNPQALTQAIEAHLKMHPTDRRKMCQQNRQHIETHFDINQVLETYRHHLTLGVKASADQSNPTQEQPT